MRLYKINWNINYSAQQVLKNKDKVFLIESNKSVDIGDIVSVNKNCYDINNCDFYAMIVIDKVSNNITLSYGAFSYCHSLYYCLLNNNVYINISLHELLRDTDMKPELRIKSVHEFVNNGFVRGENTLIEEIKKVPSLKTVIIKNDSIETINSVYIKREGLSNYVDNLKLSLPTKGTKIVLPLSGGFDSTLLAYLIKDNKEKIAFSVGSLEDVKSTELPNAKKTAAYLHIPQQEIHPDNRWIESFPKIVDIMEGEMFDIGIFLCYFIVDKIKQLNFTDYTVLTGDGADQLLNKNFYTEDIETEPMFIRHSDIFLHRYPKHFFYYLIVKKMEWLLRLEGINYVMPFISKEFCNFAGKNTFTEQKEEYKHFVKTYLPSEISYTLVKKGGLVYPEYFVNRKIYHIFLEILNTPKYRDLFADDEHHNDIRKTLYKMYIVFFDYIFIEGNSINNTDFYSILDKLRNDYE